MDFCEQNVNIVIPNYNGKDFLQICLASIQGQTYSSYQVTVVDNGSSDGSVELIREYHPKIRLITLSENKGFSLAVNRGIASSDHPFIFLLNNDTELAPDCLEQLMRAAADWGEFEFFAPKMLSYYERDILDGAGDGFLRGGAGYRLGTMEKDDEVYNRSRPVFGACAGAVLYRRSMFDRIGFFDEDFFAYLEDVDLNFRANRAGFSCRYIPEAIVYHIGSATTGSKINSFTVRLSTRNSFFLLVKNYPLSFFLRFFPVILTYQFCWLLFVIKKRQFVGYCSGIVSFFKGFSRMLKKRRIMPADGEISNHELARRILRAEKDVVASIMHRRMATGRGNSLLRIYDKLFL